MDITPRAPIYKSIKITCATDGATILYRISDSQSSNYLNTQDDMKNYINESPTQYSEEFQLGDTVPVYAYAKKEGWIDSDAIRFRHP